jgi:outer membrane receptor protein involved in Fe transport
MIRSGRPDTKTYRPLIARVAAIRAPVRSLPVLVLLCVSFLTHDAFAQPGYETSALDNQTADESTPSNIGANASNSAELADASLPLEDGPENLPDEALQDYVSVGTKRTARVERHPGGVTVISAAQIERMGYRSVGEALADVPGLYVSNDLRNHHVAIRGVFGGARAGSRALKVLINGRSFSFVQSGVSYLGPELVPINSIERIEVLKGPGSVAYGAGALVGAINIVTKRDPYEGEVGVHASLLAGGAVGGERGGLGNARLSVTSRSLFAMVGVAGGIFDRSGLRLPESSPILIAARPELAGRESTNDLARPLGAIGRLEYTLLGGRVGLDFFTQFYDVDGEFHDQSPLSGATRTRLFHWKTVLSYERAFASGLSVLGNVGLANGQPLEGDQLLLPGQSNPRIREFRYLEISGQLEGRYEFENLAHVSLGFDFSVDNETLQSFAAELPDGMRVPLRTVPAQAPEETLTNVAGYLAAQWPITSWLHLSGGLRLDWHNIYEEALSGHAGIVLPLTEAFSIKLLFGRSYKAPSAEQLFGVTQDTTDIVGNPDLSPSFLNSGELELHYFVAPWLKASASAFFNRLEDGIAYVQRSREANEFIATTYDATSYGGELTLRQANTFGPVRLLTTAAVALQDTEVDEQELVGGRSARPVPDNESVPQLSVWARVTLELADIYTRFFVGFRHVGKRTPSQTNLREAGTPYLGDPIYQLDDYQMLDIGASTMPIALGRFGRLSGLFRLSNVLDSDYQEIGFLGVDVPALGTTGWLQVRVEL